MPMSVLAHRASPDRVGARTASRFAIKLATDDTDQVKILVMVQDGHAVGVVRHARFAAGRDLGFTPARVECKALFPSGWIGRTIRISGGVYAALRATP
jgi:hypothetical protein